MFSFSSSTTFFIKVKRVMVKPKKLIAQIQLDHSEHKEYSIEQVLPIHTFHQELSQSSSRIEQNEKFIYQQLLFDCLSRMHPTTDTKDEFVQRCRDRAGQNKIEFELIDEFDRNYCSERALWWFTRDTCISRLFIQAFETMDMDLLYASQFFLRDLREQIEAKPLSQSLHLYRAQLMSTSELRHLKDSMGEIISIDTFLLTSLHRERALELLKETNLTNNMRRVLFEIDIDPHRMHNKVCFDMSASHYYTGTQVILFLPGSIFYPIDISIEDDVIIIQMVAESNEHDEIQEMIDHLDVKYYDREGETNLLVLGQILFRMGRIDEAQKYYQRLLNELPDDHSLVAHCYQDLGQMMVEIKDYETSLRWYFQSLEIYRRILRPIDPEIATLFCTIGDVYSKKKSFIDALEYYHQAIEIYSESLGKDHGKVMNCYRLMGVVCEEQQDYQHALEFYQTALSIREKHPVNHHQELAELHRHIADVYNHLDEKDQALKNYRISLKIFRSLDPIPHTDAIITMRSIALIYESIGRVKKALFWFKKVANEV